MFQLIRPIKTMRFLSSNFQGLENRDQVYDFFIHFRQNNNKNYTKTEFGTVLEMTGAFFKLFRIAGSRKSEMHRLLIRTERFFALHSAFIFAQ
jgi:hypothetical protein